MSETILASTPDAIVDTNTHKYSSLFFLPVSKEPKSAFQSYYDKGYCAHIDKPCLESCLLRETRNHKLAD